MAETKTLTAFRFDPALLQALRFVKERDGVSISDQVRRALETWLESNEATVGGLYRAIDRFEDSLTRTSNRGESLAQLRLPKEFGRLLGARAFGSLAPQDFEALERLLHTMGRRDRSHRYFWERAVRQARQAAADRRKAR